MKFREYLTEKTNLSVSALFIKDEFPKDKKSTWGTSNLKINKENNGWSLINYFTPILYRKNGSKIVYFNIDKYSHTTTVIQNKIRKELNDNSVEFKEVNEDKIKEEIEK